MNRQQQIDQFLANAHRLAIDRLRADPSALERVRAQLTRWRAASGATRSDAYWDEWDAREGMIDIATLLARIRLLDQHEQPIDSIVAWAQRRAAEAQP